MTCPTFVLSKQVDCIDDAVEAFCSMFDKNYYLIVMLFISLITCSSVSYLVVIFLTALCYAWWRYFELNVGVLNHLACLETGPRVF